MATIDYPIPTITLWAYPLQFGTKRLMPPPPPPQLTYPTTAGPNASAALDGALLPPAAIPDAGLPNNTVANVEFTLSPGDISSNITVGILPFRDGG